MTGFNIKLAAAVMVLGVLIAGIFGRPSRYPHFTDDTPNTYTNENGTFPRLYYNGLSLIFPDPCHSPYEFDQKNLPSFRVQGYSSRPNGPNSTLVSWYFNLPEEACKPLYLNAGYSAYEGNSNLPRSKDECEDICGTKCFYETQLEGGEKYKRGYCAYDEYCEGGSLPAAFGTCDYYGVNCCKVKFDSKSKPIPKLGQPVIYPTSIPNPTPNPTPAPTQLPSKELIV